MPAVRSSTPTSLQGWVPVASQTPPTQPVSSVESNPYPRSTMMRAAMPIMASTNDAFVRQYYGQQNIPQQRILPAKKSG